MISVSDTKLAESSIALFGKFNPFIFAPDWLREHLVFNSVGLNLGVSERGVHLQLDNCQWSVDDVRLEITGPDNLIAKQAEKVLQLLPHTPVTAIVARFEFECASEKWIGPVPSIGDPELKSLGNLEIQQQQWRCELYGQDEAVVSSVTISRFDHQIFVIVDRHRTVTNTVSGIDAARMFAWDCKFSKDIVDELTENPSSEATNELAGDEINE